MSAYLGQERAINAIRFGIQMEHDGYNVFVLGPLGSARHRLVEELAKEPARAKGAPDDWCYINNFSNPERPRALRLPAGKGAEFRDNMQSLIEEIRLAIPAAFENDDYRNQLKALEAETQKEVDGLWRSLDEQAAKEGIALLQTPTGYVLAPVSDDKVIDDKEFNKLPDERRKEIKESIQRLSGELKTRIETMPKLQKRHRERVRALDRDVTAHAVSVLLEDLKQTYQALPAVLGYLQEVQRDIIENAQEFRRTEEPALPFLSRDATALFASYEVNLVVSNESDAAAPIVYEPNPSYPNLVGKVEHRAEMGALLTDFRLVRAGALLQANGGYLVLDVHRVLGRPFVWEALKQALLTKQVRIESPAETLGFASTTTLKPEPIPLDLKILLIGERWLYYLLCVYDNEFGSLFKVAADFDDDVERSTDNVEAYARLITERVRENGLLPLGAAAIARVIEQRARYADDSERLSMHMHSLDDLLKQADYWARQRGADEVAIEDVIEAVRQQDDRQDRFQKKIVDAIKRDTLLIDTSGECVGQVNGLSVTDLGEYRFGHPVRITATTRVGKGDVVDIEREVNLGGAIHSKGVMILSSALAARYAPDVPLSLHGSVVFEQSYGGVEGDSASVAELCALLSSISGVPIRQNFAVTGSVNQLGRVQVVGGTNEKIEGFFAICKERGLDGSHAVIIPRDNIKHLMLAEEVIEAVRKNLFSVYAVQTIDEAVAVLTGMAAGERNKDGEFPPDTLNRLVEDRLIQFASRRQQFSEGAGDDKEHK
ncbi:MAG: AAA family ATPase [Gammaproteobacteria bacterium]|nr:AAA family ATPase [Gammaproteobacteria bacterium]NNL44038.1 AAA family ATPase [Woeseiaceae bacterium]